VSSSPPDETGPGRAPRGPVLVTQGLTAGYGGPPIIQNVGIEAGSGRVTAVVGPNGAGKSTLLKAIAGLIRPAAGRVLLNGSDVTGLAPEKLIREGIAYVPQAHNVFPTLTVRENLEVGGYTRAAGLRDRIEFITTMFPDLGAAMKRPARTLSGGQRNMLAMARGLMVDPAVLLLDEPSTGLSPRFIATVWEHIRAVCRSGVAVVVVEQNTRQTLAQAAWAYVMALGATRLAGPGPDLLRDEEVVDLYVGRLT